LQLKDRRIAKMMGRFAAGKLKSDGLCALLLRQCRTFHLFGETSAQELQQESAAR
jgi:hypothetical protein